LSTSLCWNTCRGCWPRLCQFVSLDRYAVGKLSHGSGGKGDDGLGLAVDGKLSCPAIVDNLDLPKAILGVAPPLQDGLAVECYFATFL
jgi:hypothetical protein